MSWKKFTLLLWVFLVFSQEDNGRRIFAQIDAAISPTSTLRQDILSLMGLARKPKPSVFTRLYGRRMSAPRYMVKLYNSIAQNRSFNEGFCCNGTIADWRALRADTIMSYLNQVRGISSKISRHHVTFKFPFQSPAGEKVTATEFRIFKKHKPQNKQSWQNTTYLVRLYQIIYPARVLDLLDSRVVRSWDAGWQSFDITKAGKAWSENSSTNHGLELSVVNWLNEEVSPHKAGFIGYQGPLDKRPFVVSFFQLDGELYQRAYLHEIRQNLTSRISRSFGSGGSGGAGRGGVGGNETGSVGIGGAGVGNGGIGGIDMGRVDGADTGRGGVVGTDTGRRGVGGAGVGNGGVGTDRGGVGGTGRGGSGGIIREGSEGNRGNFGGGGNDGNRTNYESGKVYHDPAGSKSCQRHSLYVTFRELGWDGWIIAPEGYSAFFCHGKCPFPINSIRKVANHAIVQILLNVMKPESVPRPCCAPTKLSPISVLFFDDKNNVVLKKYHDMVVNECGCN